MDENVNSDPREDAQDMREQLELLRQQVLLLTEKVALLEGGRSSESMNDETDALEVVSDQVHEVQLPHGWQQLKDHEGRSYYVGPDGESTWEMPMIDSVPTLDVQNPILKPRRSSIRRNSLAGKRRSSMRVVAAKLARKDMG